MDKLLVAGLDYEVGGLVDLAVTLLGGVAHKLNDRQTLIHRCLRELGDDVLHIGNGYVATYSLEDYADLSDREHQAIDALMRLKDFNFTVMVPGQKHLTSKYRTPKAKEIVIQD